MEFRRPTKNSIPGMGGRPNGFVYIIIIALVITGIYLLVAPENLGPKATEVPLNQIQQEYADGTLKAIDIKGNKITADTVNGDRQVSYKSTGDKWTELRFFDPKNPTPITTSNEDADKFWMDLLSSLLPFIIIIVILFFMLRQAQSGASNALSFGKSSPRVNDKSKNKTTFADVAGADEAKQELIEIVDFLKNPKKYIKMGAKIPKGVLLVGAPGTGKTLLARAVAGEADVPFFSISGSEFVEMFVGVGASRVRDLFTKAKRNAPSIIFIDEIDAVGRQRGTGLGGGHDEREQTLNQILTEMDGFETGTNVIVMAATNRPDVLDPALMRPGRFDRRVIIDKPDLKEREAILKVHARNKPLAKDVNLEKIAKQTPGFAGADLDNLLNESAILAAKENKPEITQYMIERSIEKVMMGPEKKSKLLSLEEKKIVAYHETGHAIVGHIMPYMDPVHKISVISRGMALGVTWHLPEADIHLYSKAKFDSELASLMGGRVAEELVFGLEKITTGASNDLEHATAIARQMVTDFGMSELGPVVYGDKHGSVFIGRDLLEHKNYSEDVAKKIDEAIKKKIEDAYQKARGILEKYRDKMDIIAKELLKKETLVGDEFVELLEGKKEPKTPAKKASKSKPITAIS
jgi:cell division protease FtsH